MSLYYGSMVTKHYLNVNLNRLICVLKSSSRRSLVHTSSVDLNDESSNNNSSNKIDQPQNEEATKIAANKKEEKKRKFKSFAFKELDNVASTTFVDTELKTQKDVIKLFTKIRPTDSGTITRPPAIEYSKSAEPIRRKAARVDSAPNELQ